MIINSEPKEIDNQMGFSLVELLVVVAIIGIIAGIAVPKWLEYKRQSLDSRAVSDLRNFASAEEAYFVDAERYSACNTSTCQTVLPGFRSSLRIKINAGLSTTGTVFGVSTCHELSNSVFKFLSSDGIQLKESIASCAADPALPTLP